MRNEFYQRLLTDAAFRARVLDGVADDVRAYVAHLDEIVPRQTVEALLRRIHDDLSFPEARLSVPPEAEHGQADGEADA